MAKKEPFPKKHYHEVWLTQQTLIQEFGLSRALIDQYFPEPRLKRNPHGRNAPSMRLWEQSTVQEVLKNKELQREMLKIQARQEKKKERVRKIQQLLGAEDLSHLEDQGAGLDRRFILHVGPTNSGKTYAALQALKMAKSGVYLGPLRLLALEVADTLNAEGIPCNLLTGEESVPAEGASITASTMEMCPFDGWYDVAVIDEAQMMADPSRGDNWTKAIYRLRAKEIHVCLAPEALEIMERILRGMDTDYSIVKHERLCPLSFEGTMKSILHAQPGDALIVFSRREVLAIAAALKGKGIEASVIYGALPPASRREEVRRYVEGETKVVVATDAIGMGISLPIKRVIFCTTMKYDGVETRKLHGAEILQIAGRAGRFGKFDHGEVLTLGDARLISHALTHTVPDIESLTIPFPVAALNSEYSLKELMETWQTLPKDPVFRRVDLTEALTLYNLISKHAKAEDKNFVFQLITCPVDTKSEELSEYWRECCLRILDGKRPRPPYFETETLEGAERQYRGYDIYHQMLRRIGVEEDCMSEKQKLCEKINAFLKKDMKNYQKTCKICKKPLPPMSRYGICESCYEKRYGDFDW